MKFIDNTIIIDRPLNDLDKLVIKFVRIVEKHIEYVIISGYVSILFGRTRGTEDVDIFIKEIDYESFKELYAKLKKEDFWCLNTEKSQDAYKYLKEDFSVRFAEKGVVIPNFKVRFARKPFEIDVFSDLMKVKTQEGTINISSIERQIAFKRYYLKSEKDLEDAKYLEEVFKDKIDNDKIRIYKRVIDKLWNA